MKLLFVKPFKNFAVAGIILPLKNLTLVRVGLYIFLITHVSSALFAIFLIQNPPIINNPNKSIYGISNARLLEVQTFGKNIDNEDYLYKIRGIAVDQFDNLYILDAGNFRIVKYNNSGIVVTSFGKKGQGPGELQFPISLKVDEPTSKLYVNDMYRILIFDFNGKYIDQIRLPKPIGDFIILDENTILGKSYGGDENSFYAELLKIHTDGLFERFNRYPRTVGLLYDQKGRISFIATGYEYDVYFARINNNNFAIGYSKEYKINVVNRKLENVVRILKKENPLEIPGELLKTYPHLKMQKANLFRGILSDENNIYVIRQKKEVGEGGKVNLDIFSLSGRYLREIILPVTSILLIKQGCIYVRKANENSEYIAKYRIIEESPVLKK